jgi:hypothetical protein
MIAGSFSGKKLYAQTDRFMRMDRSVSTIKLSDGKRFDVCLLKPKVLLKP